MLAISHFPAIAILITAMRANNFIGVFVVKAFRFTRFNSYLSFSLFAGLALKGSCTDSPRCFL